MKNLLTSLQLGLLGGRQSDKSAQPPRFSLLLSNLAPQLFSLHTQLLCVLFKCHELVPPQIGLRHKEVEAARETTDLRLKVISRVDESRGAFADGELDVLFGLG
jgi:hypothetical protein